MTGTCSNTCRPDETCLGSLLFYAILRFYKHFNTVHLLSHTFSPICLPLDLPPSFNCVD